MLRQYLNAFHLVTFLVLAKLCGLYKEVLLARTYGLNVDLDAFNFAMNTANVVSGVLLSSLSVTLASMMRFSSAKRDRFFRELTGAIIVFGVAASGVAFIVISLSHAVYSSLAILLLSSLMAPTCLAALLSAILLLGGTHINSILECVPAAALAAALLMWGKLDIEQLTLAVTCGLVLQCAFLIFFSRQSGLIERPSFSVSSRLWRKFGNSIMIVLIGQGVMAIVSVGDTYMLLGEKDGSLTEFSFASRAVSIALTLLALTISRLALPVFANRQGSPLKSAVFWSLAILVATCLMLLVTYPFRFDIISLLYQNGDFGPTEVQRVTASAAILSLQVPFYAAGIMLVAAFASTGRYLPMVVTATAAGVTKLVIYWANDWAVSTQLVAVSTVAMYAVSYVVYLVWVLGLITPHRCWRSRA
jgi:putative peptidoglycan lipid II flippase